MIKYVSGDLFGPMLADNTPGTIIIPHVVNSKGAWGSGFVVPLGRKYPLAKNRYYNWHSNGHETEEWRLHRRVPFELGVTQFVRVSGPEAPTQIIVANMLAQTLGGARPLYYQHLAACMTQVAGMCQHLSEQLGLPARIHAPAFGAGLAGGDWAIIKELIADCWLRDLHIPVSIYYLPGTVPQVEAEAALQEPNFILEPALEAEIAHALANDPPVLTQLEQRLRTETPEDFNDFNGPLEGNE